MSETKHTEAPWQVSLGTGEILGVRDGCSIPIIAKMGAWWPRAEEGHVSQALQLANALELARAFPNATDSRLYDERGHLFACCCL